jgi:hypothetical protein
MRPIVRRLTIRYAQSVNLCCFGRGYRTTLLADFHAVIGIPVRSRSELRKNRQELVSYAGVNHHRETWIT